MKGFDLDRNLSKFDYAVSCCHSGFQIRDYISYVQKHLFWFRWNDRSSVSYYEDPLQILSHILAVSEKHKEGTDIPYTII